MESKVQVTLYFSMKMITHLVNEANKKQELVNVGPVQYAINETLRVLIEV